MTTIVTPGVVVDVIRDAAGFRALEDEWRELYAASPAATPFQTWEWLFSWWEVYGQRGRLRLLTARRDGRLVGAFPLMVATPGHLQFVGTGLSDHLDLLVAAEDADDVLGAWADQMHGNPRLRVLDLHEVRPEAAVWRLYGRWPHPRGHYAQSTCLEFDVRPLDDVLASWSQNTRRAARTAMNRIAKGGYTEHWAAADEIGDMAERLVAEHQQMWQQRGGITPAHAEPRFTTFVRAFCERLARHDGVALLRVEPPPDTDAPMELTELMLVGHEYIGGWLSAYNEVARKRMSIAIIENVHGVMAGLRHDVEVMSMLRGTEQGKERTGERAKINHRLLLAGRGPAALVAWARRAAPAAAMARLKRWERDSETGQRVTALLRTARDRVRP